MSPLKAAQLEFLIHAGYNSWSETPRCGAELEEALVHEARNSFTLDLYIERAKLLNRQSIMLIICHRSAEEFNADLQQQRKYAIALAELINILRERAILIHDAGMEIFEKPEEDLSQSSVVRQFLGVLKNRDIILPPEVPSFAYGESLAHCVPRVADALNATLRLQQETVVLTRLTDFAYQTRGEIEAAIQEAKQGGKFDFECLRFDIHAEETC